MTKTRLLLNITESKDCSGSLRTRTDLRVACGTFGQIDSTGCVKRGIGSGRPNSATTDEKIEVVEELNLSQKNFLVRIRVNEKLH